MDKQIRSMFEGSVRRCIFGMDDDQGVPEEVYRGLCGIVEMVFGTDGLDVFIRYVDATDGRFYLKQGTAGECWAQLNR